MPNDSFQQPPPNDSLNDSLDHPQRNPQADLGDRLQSIEAQLQQLPQVLSALESIAARLVRLEENSMLMADIYRYGTLRDLLAAGEWRRADDETIRIILALAGESDLDSLMPEQVLHMPCNGLRVIDQLWQHYSDGRYGFGVQLRIYLEEGGSVETAIAQDQSVIARLGHRVGWRKDESWLKCDELDYLGAAPEGCLPARWWNSPFGAKMTSYFFRRLLMCNL